MRWLCWLSRFLPLAARWLMAFRPPRFNLLANLWRSASVTAPPTSQFHANLSPGRRTMLSTSPVAAAAWFAQAPQSGDVVELLCPALTDIRGAQAVGVTDVVEVPAGSSRYYFVFFADDVAKGFPNEYRLAFLRQIDFALSAQWTAATGFTAPAWPVPTP
jgi:hypothetical protein